MRTFAGFTLSLLVLGLTTSLILAKPLLYGFEYGLKKGWFRFPRMFS